MVKLQDYLHKTNVPSQRNLPMLNSLFIDRFSEFGTAGSENNFKKFMNWARRSPQVMGFLNIIVTDMLSDDITFNALKKESGRNKALKAKAFWDANKGLEIAEETLYDFLITGIGYNWLGTIGKVQLKEYCNTMLKTMLPEVKEQVLEFKAEELAEKIINETPEKLTKKLRHVASSSMTIVSDEYEVTGYVQRVAGNRVVFKTEEILEFRLLPFDGKVYPLPPMESLLAEVYLLWLITQNYVSFFENGGKPDNVFILPKEIAGSKNHQYLIDTLTKYKKIQNKHGNMVFTGDLTVEKLMDVEQQMENKDLGLYLTSVLAMMYGIPVSRIPFLVGKSATSGDSGGLADSGYWRKISVWQSKIESVYNRKLWVPFFGVEMKFARGYLQDEVRETQNDMQKTQVAEQRVAIGVWTVEEAGNYLGIDLEEIKKAQEEKKKRDDEMMKSQMLNQNLNTKDNVQKNPDAKKKAKDKQTTQNNNQTAAGGKNISP